jgi:hypothetical protein
MGPRRFSVVALALVVAALCTGTAAAAAPPLGELGGIFELQGTHGFKVLGLLDSKGRKAELTLFVGRPRERATYIARGTREGEELDFDLGSLGKVEVEAQPTGRKETVRPMCGKPFTLEGIDFVGTIEFHGEEGFTEARALRTPLRFDFLADIGCGASSGGEGFFAQEPGARLKVARKGGPRLQINQNHPGAAVHYEAQITEQVPGVTIRRTVLGHFGGGAFAFDPTLTRASFAPGAPFTGSAIYRGSHSPRGTHPAKGAWSGDLTVDFPGRADVPLTGPGFKAAIIHANRTESGP